MFLKVDKTTLIDLTGTHITAVCKGKPKDNEEADFEIWHLIVIHDITAYRKMFNVRSDTDLAIQQNFSGLESFPEPADDYSTYTIIQKCETRWGGEPFRLLLAKIEEALHFGEVVFNIINTPEWLDLEASEGIVNDLGMPTAAEQQDQALLDEPDVPNPKDALKKL